MKRFKTFVFAILAGICIGIGGTVFLSLDNKMLGSALFTIGLFTIVTHGFNLFTGKVCYIFEKEPGYTLDTLIILLGNLVGCVVMGALMLSTRYGDALYEKAASIVALKLNDGLGSIFVLAIFCNMLIFIGVDGFNRNSHELGKYLALFFGIMVFILCGFEHCVANMYYFTVARAWSGRAVLYLIVMVLGNAVGGVFFPVVRMLFNKKETAAK